MPLDRKLTRQSKFSVISQGQLEGTTVFTTEVSLMRKQNVIEIQSVVESVIILYEYREIINCQTIARNSRTRFASWERCDGRFSNRPWQKHDFYRVLIFVHARHELSPRTSIIVYPIHTEIFAPKLNEINFIPGRTVFVTSEKYRPTNHRPRTALCH